MSEARTVYLNSIGLGAANKKKARDRALQRAHEVRQFEIELYWKRANYFWLLQAAVFAAVGLTWRPESTLPHYVPLALSCLGLLTAEAGWLGTQGSKFWQRNWEHHIDMLEGEFEGNLYKTVYITRKGGVRWSLSGVSENLAMCFMAFWACVLVATCVYANPNWDLWPPDISAPSSIEGVTLVLLAATAIGAWRLHRRKGGIKGELIPYPTDFQLGESYSPQRLAKFDQDVSFVLMRREPKIW